MVDKVHRKITLGNTGVEIDLNNLTSDIQKKEATKSVFENFMPNGNALSEEATNRLKDVIFEAAGNDGQLTENEIINNKDKFGTRDAGTIFAFLQDAQNQKPEIELSIKKQNNPSNDNATFNVEQQAAATQSSNSSSNSSSQATPEKVIPATQQGQNEVITQKNASLSNNNNIDNSASNYRDSNPKVYVAKRRLVKQRPNYTYHEALYGKIKFKAKVLNKQMPFGRHAISYIDKSGKERFAVVDHNYHVLKDSYAEGTALFAKFKNRAINCQGKMKVIVTQNGKKYYFDAHNMPTTEAFYKKVQTLKILKNQNQKAQNALNHAKRQNGLFGKVWDWTKNTFNFGDSSDKVQTQINKQKQLVRELEAGKIKPEYAYSTSTGRKPKNLADEILQINTNKKYAQQLKTIGENKVQAYKEGQDEATDFTADIIVGLSTASIATAAVAAAPFTGGASLLFGVVLAAGIGAVEKPLLKYADNTCADESTYGWKDVPSDIMYGSIDGGLSMISYGTGGAIAKGAVTQIGKRLLPKAASGAIKQIFEKVAISEGKVATEQTASKLATNGLKTAEKELKQVLKESKLADKALDKAERAAEKAAEKFKSKETSKAAQKVLAKNEEKRLAQKAAE